MQQLPLCLRRLLPGLIALLAHRTIGHGGLDTLKSKSGVALESS